MEDHTIDPLGSTRAVKVDIRVIGATNQDLSDLIKKGRFREDLYYRFHVCPLHLPPLRERQEDIPALLDAFLKAAEQDRGSRIRGVSPEALALLQAYPWPGNIRELHNVVEWITISCREGVITAEHLPAYLRSTGGPSKEPASNVSLLSFGLSVDELEKAMLKEALDKTNGNVSEASRLLKITRNTLRYRMMKYQLAAHDKES
jgi:two-component system NtrC family response regulator/two-component system response regulator HydG